MSCTMSYTLFTSPEPIADVSNDNNADLLYYPASQVVDHLQSYLLSMGETRKVLGWHQRETARFARPDAGPLLGRSDRVEIKITKGFTELKPIACTASANEPVLDYRHSLNDKSKMVKYLFGGFRRCVCPVQKFQSDSERDLLSILIVSLQSSSGRRKGNSRWFTTLPSVFSLLHDPLKYAKIPNSGTNMHSNMHLFLSRESLVAIVQLPRLNGQALALFPTARIT